MRKEAQALLRTFESIFHYNWSYSSEKLNEGIFENGETFIECEWISNWSNKDELDLSYKKLKDVLSKPTVSSSEMHQCLKKFLNDLETIFNSDWEYTKLNLNIESSIVPESATFLYPYEEDTVSNIDLWEYRDNFLKQYQKILMLLN